MTGVGRTYAFEVRENGTRFKLPLYLLRPRLNNFLEHLLFSFALSFFRDLRMVLDFFPTVVLRVRNLRWNEKEKKIIR